MAPLRAVFVGRLAPEKCVIDLLHAWRIVKDRAERPVSLRLLGDGPQEEELRQICADQGIEDSVEFFGFCRDVPSELARADIFTLSSSHEGNSNAILEAMRAGLPIAATRVGGAAMQVGEPGQPWLVRVHHPEELAQSILRLIEDDALRRDLGASMRARIEEIFAIERVAGVYEQAYERIVSGRREEVGDLNATLFEGVEP